MNSPAVNILAQTFQEAVRYHQLGRLDEAEALYQRVLVSNRNHAESLLYLGICRHDRGDFETASKHIRAALRLRPDMAGAHLSYGNVLREQKRLSEAIASYSRAATLDPRLALAHYNLGTAYEEQGQHARALAAYDKALALGFGGAAAGRGNCLVAAGRNGEAIAAYRDALALDPRDSATHANLAAALLKEGRHDEALQATQAALALDPSHAAAALNRAVILHELGRPIEALEGLEQALAQAPAGAENLFQRACTLARLRRHDEAFALLEKLLAEAPRHWGARFEKGAGLIATGQPELAEPIFAELAAERPDDVYCIMQRGLLTLHMGNLDEARRLLELAGERNPAMPGLRFPLSQLDLLDGRFESGLRLFEGRWEEPSMRVFQRNFAQPLWLGEEDISGQTLLVHCEQGVGDSIQFTRYLPLLLGRARHVLFAAPDPLASLLRRSLPADIPLLGSGQVPPAFDRHVPLMSLPLALRTTLDSIPPPLPALRPDPVRVEIWRNRLRDRAGLRIGLAWSGNPGHGLDRYRSMPLQEMHALLRIGQDEPALAGVEFIALQNDLRPRDREALAQAPMLHYFGETIETFEDSAALVEFCDLVITVDTAPAHLAAAMGKPVWLLLAYLNDWRWMRDRSDSPWYPTMRIYRQPQRYDWASVLAQVTRDLAEFARTGSGRRDPRPAAGSHTGASAT